MRPALHLPPIALRCRPRAAPAAPLRAVQVGRHGGGGGTWEAGGNRRRRPPGPGAASCDGSQAVLLLPPQLADRFHRHLRLPGHCAGRGPGRRPQGPRRARHALHHHRRRAAERQRHDVHDLGQRRRRRGAAAQPGAGECGLQPAGQRRRHLAALQLRGRGAARAAGRGAGDVVRGCGRRRGDLRARAAELRAVMHGLDGLLRHGDYHRPQHADLRLQLVRQLDALCRLPAPQRVRGRHQLCA